MITGRLAREIGVGRHSRPRRARRGRRRDTRTCAAVGIGADDDVGELLGVGEAALRLDVELEGAARAHRAAGRARRRRPGRSARAAPRRSRRRSGRARRRGRDRSTPASHSRATPNSCTSPTPSMRRQPVADLGQRIVGDIAAIERLVGRDEVDDHQEVGRGLARHDAQPLHFLRQARHRDRDAVLHQHLRGIEVGADA